MTNSRLHARRRFAPDDDIEFSFASHLLFFQSFVDSDAAMYEPSSSEGDLEASKAFKLHAYHETLWAQCDTLVQVLPSLKSVG